MVPPLSHIDLDRELSSFDEAVAAAVELAHEHGLNVFDFTGRLPYEALATIIDDFERAV